MQQFETLSKIGAKLGIAESTGRYYVKKYEEFFTIEGEGRKRKFAVDNATAILSCVSKGYAKGLTEEQVRGLLEKKFEKHTIYETVVEYEPKKKPNARAQESNNGAIAEVANNKALENLFGYFEKTNEALQVISTQNKAILNQQQEIINQREELNRKELDLEKNKFLLEEKTGTAEAQLRKIEAQEKELAEKETAIAQLSRRIIELEAKKKFKFFGLFS